MLQVLLQHPGCGHSLLETAVRANQAGLAELSSVALWNPLGKSQAWLSSLCLKLYRDRGLAHAVDVVADDQHKLLPGMKKRHRRRKLGGTLQIDDDYTSG